MQQMAKVHRGCLLIGNLPRHWADEPEKATKTLQQISPAPILQNLCCIQVSPDQVHKALGGGGYSRTYMPRSG